jgi:cell division cycle 20, cofactor of APC complex
MRRIETPPTLFCFSILCFGIAGMYKTPTRSRSVTGTSRGTFSTSTSIDVNFGNLTISSPTKGRKTGPADTTNPFLKSSSGPKSRPASPIKRITGQGSFNVSDELKRQASQGMLRKGAIESRMDIITIDRDLPRPAPISRSKSQPAVKVRL